MKAIEEKNTEKHILSCHLIPWEKDCVQFVWYLLDPEELFGLVRSFSRSKCINFVVVHSQVHFGISAGHSFVYVVWELKLLYLLLNTSMRRTPNPGKPIKNYEALFLQERWACVDKEGWQSADWVLLAHVGAVTCGSRGDINPSHHVGWLWSLLCQEKSSHCWPWVILTSAQGVSFRISLNYSMWFAISEIPYEGLRNARILIMPEQG